MITKERLSALIEEKRAEIQAQRGQLKSDAKLVKELQQLKQHRTYVSLNPSEEALERDLDILTNRVKVMNEAIEDMKDEKEAVRLFKKEVEYDKQVKQIKTLKFLLEIQ